MDAALIFPGQGAQYVGMGVSFSLENSPVKRLYGIAERILGAEFLRICFHGPADGLTSSSVCQPAIFLHGYAAASVLGKIPKVAYGLSLGELTALCMAGVFDFETGLTVVAERGRLMQDACERTDGAMLCLLGGTMEDVATLCEAAAVEAANLNCPGQVVVAGGRKNIEKALEIAAKMPFRRALPLNVAGAFHSRLMESAAVGFEKFLQDIEFQPPRTTVLTNVTGERVESSAEIRALLVRQIVSPVLFEKCCRTAMGMGVSRFFECGPGKALGAMVKKIDASAAVTNFDSMEDFATT
jgi:[acyl-carrier-protein] S-malonyltransferase